VIPPGWIPVQSGAAVGAGVEDGRAVVGIGIDPADRRHDVLAGTEDRDNLVLVGKQRTVNHTVSVHGEDRIDVARRSHPDRIEAHDLADVLAVLGLGVHPRANQCQVGMGQRRLNRRLAHAAGRPLHHPDGHGRIHAGMTVTVKIRGSVTRYARVFTRLAHRPRSDVALVRQLCDGDPLMARRRLLHQIVRRVYVICISADEFKLGRVPVRSLGAR
jgi:hypothetical protein